MHVTISSKSVSICNRSHARQVIIAVNNDLLELPLFDALVLGNLLTQEREIWSQKLDSAPSRGEDQECLSHLGLVRYRDVTYRWTERITIASSPLALRAVARKNEVAEGTVTTRCSLFHVLLVGNFAASLCTLKP